MLSAVAERGCAIAGMREGLNGNAAPVRGADGKLVATLAMLDTIAEIGRDVAEETIEDLKATALKLSRMLGFTETEHDSRA